MFYLTQRYGSDVSKKHELYKNKNRKCYTKKLYENIENTPEVLRYYNLNLTLYLFLFEKTRLLNVF